MRTGDEQPAFTTQRYTYHDTHTCGGEAILVAGSNDERPDWHGSLTEGAISPHVKNIAEFAEYNRTGCRGPPEVVPGLFDRETLQPLLGPPRPKGVPGFSTQFCPEQKRWYYVGLYSNVVAWNLYVFKVTYVLSKAKFAVDWRRTVMITVGGQLLTHLPRGENGEYPRQKVITVKFKRLTPETRTYRMVIYTAGHPGERF